MPVTIHQCSTNPLYAALFYGAPPLTSWRQIAEEQHFFFVLHESRVNYAVGPRVQLDALALSASL